MEQYEYFCAISRQLYRELEIAASMEYSLTLQGINGQYWYQRKLDLLHDIELHLNDFDRVLFEYELLKQHGW